MAKVNLKSLHGKLFYSFLKKKLPEDNFDITLEELKGVLMAPTLAHTYSNLRLRVLDRIIDEFKETECPIQFQYSVKEDEIINIVIETK